MYQAGHLPLTMFRQLSRIVRYLLADLLHRLQRCLQAKPFSPPKVTGHVLFKILTDRNARHMTPGKGHV